MSSIGHPFRPSVTLLLLFCSCPICIWFLAKISCLLSSFFLDKDTMGSPNAISLLGHGTEVFLTEHLGVVVQ